MSVYKDKLSPFYRYDFQIKGRRFYGSTETANRREAEKIEEAAKERAKIELGTTPKSTSAKNAPLTIDAAAGRYWTEVGQHHVASDTTFRDLGRLVDYFGKAKLLKEITSADVANLIAWRRSHRVKGRKTVGKGKNKSEAPLIAPATVNRSTIEPLQKLFNRAKRVWKQEFPDEPDWTSLLLKEPQERVRELRGNEAAAVDRAIRADYLPILRFARVSGLRQKECILKKSEVDLTTRRITRRGKGGVLIHHPITSAMFEILVIEMQNKTDYVFTYRLQRPLKRAGKLLPKGTPLPITQSGLKTVWRRAKRPSDPKKKTAIPEDLRFHDLRHDYATKLLRKTKNLKLVQRALHHQKIETTLKYAHVLDEDVAAGMEELAQDQLAALPKADESEG